jgi:integrase
MARKTITGLYQRSGIWHIDKVVKGERLQESTGTSEREEAEQYLIHRLEQLRQQRVYGVRRTRIWREAATRYLVEFADQPSAWLTATYLEQLDTYIGDLPLTHIDDDSLEPYVQHRRNAGISHRTINIALERVIRILNVCARKWRDEERRPWLDTVPMITKLDEKKTKRLPYPMSWEEQSLLFAELPDHLRRMALYKVNTGSREQEVCKLRWDWEIKVPQLDTSVFLIPAQFGGRQEGSGVKNGEERLVVLNRVAKSVIDQQRGLHPEYVFPYGKPAGPMHRMNDSAWRKARKRAAAKWEEVHGSPAHPGFTSFRVHDLKHTFGRRLRAADVTKEDRQVLLGHTNGSVTSDYSAAELGHLIEVANKVAATDSRGPVLTILKRRHG